NPPPAVAEKLHRLYAGEVTYLDEHLGVLFDDLKRRGLWEKTLVVLTADHGEEFHEHGGWWHGTTLYDEQLAVPLIVKPARGGSRGVVNEAMVSSVDIAPTVIASAGLAVPEQMVGKPLGLGAGAPAPRDHSFAESELEGNNLQ